MQPSNPRSPSVKSEKAIRGTIFRYFTTKFLHKMLQTRRKWHYFARTLVTTLPYRAWKLLSESTFSRRHALEQPLMPSSGYERAPLDARGDPKSTRRSPVLPETVSMAPLTSLLSCCACLSPDGLVVHRFDQVGPDAADLRLDGANYLCRVADCFRSRSLSKEVFCSRAPL